MKIHEKRAFLKFFFIYFLSVAILILAVGLFYFMQMKNQYLKNEEFSVIKYARDIKMGNDLSEYNKEYRYLAPDIIFKHFDIKNFKKIDREFVKYLPRDRHGRVFEVFKSTKNYEDKIFYLRLKIAFAQMILLFLFAFLSYRLAKNALKPLQKSVATLDKFAKDLIHDLNTPVTAIKLNMKLLKKDVNFKDSRALERLNKSVHTISELHENLIILLQEETFQMQKTDILSIAKEVVQIQQQIYPNINFFVDSPPLMAKINTNAMKQILQNIISNACKYNSKNGFVKIYTKEKKLYIEDSGRGIKNPQKIFERSFSGENSSGIGLDIVKRLATSMDMDIGVQSSLKGSIFILG